MTEVQSFFSNSDDCNEMDNFLGAIVSEARSFVWDNAKAKKSSKLSPNSDFSSETIKVNSARNVQNSADFITSVDTKAVMFEDCYNLSGDSGEVDSDVESVMKGLIEPEESGTSSEIMAEGYPHQVGAADHETLITAMVSETKFTEKVAKEYTNAPAEIKPVKAILPPSMAESFINVVRNLNTDDEDLAGYVDGIENMLREMTAKDQEKLIRDANKVIRELHLPLNEDQSTDAEIIDSLILEARKDHWVTAVQESQKIQKPVKQTLAKRLLMRSVMAKKNVPALAKAATIVMLSKLNLKLKNGELAILKDMYEKNPNPAVPAERDEMLDLLFMQDMRKQSKSSQRKIRKARFVSKAKL